ncbi:MAG TPA: serine hydrolase domain-containing protein [Bradyrhizobium sp.]|jgi:CubicO group peptidase (beta-lactamase class C family)
MQQRVLSALQPILDGLPAESGTTGAVVATLAGDTAEVDVVTRDSFGPPFRPDSRVLLYSFTKTILAAALLRFVVGRRLTLQDTLDRFVPQHPIAAKITPRDALAHISGLPDYGGLPEYHAAVRSSSQPWSEQEFLARTGAENLLFEPATSWAYSNIGYMLLRDVLMRVGGGDIETVLRRDIFDPLGVTTASVPLTKADLSAFTFGPSRYLADGGAPVNVAEHYDPGWVSHGVVGSSAIDAARMLRGIMETSLPAALLEQMMKPITRFASAGPGRPWRLPGYGLGLSIDLDETIGPAYGHTGGGPGVSPVVFHFPRRDPPLTIAVITDGEDVGLAETLLLKVAEQWST